MMVIGWQGISVVVPGEWALAAVGGDRRSGSLSVVGEGAGFGDPAGQLRVKWTSRQVDLEKKRAEYIKRLTVGKRGRPTGLEVRPEARVVSRRAKPKKAMVSFAWRGRECGMGLLWNCQVCGRAVAGQVSWEGAGASSSRTETGESAGATRRAAPTMANLASEILGSLEDHGTGGWETWGVDGLAFLAPEGWELEGWRRMSRYLELRFVGSRQATGWRKQGAARGQEQAPAERRRASPAAGCLVPAACKLKVARWGMVPLVLGDRTVQQWYEEVNRQRRDVSWASEPAQIKGHEGMMARGEVRVWSVKRAGWSLMRLAARSALHPPTRFEARAWHCPESNRLYLVEALEAPGGETLEGVVESITCHEE